MKGAFGAGLAILRRWAGSLRGAIVLLVVLGLLIPAAVASAVMLHRQREEGLAALAADQARLVDILAQGMEQPLWNLNPAEGQPLVDAIMGDQRVVRVEVRDPVLGVFAQGRGAAPAGRTYSLRREVRHQGQAIGSVLLEMSDASLVARMAANRAWLLVVVGAQLLVSLLFILVLLQRRLLNPLRRLMAEAGRLEHRQLEAPFVWERGDELGRLGNRLEATRQALRGLFSQLEDKNRELQEDIAMRERAEAERAASLMREQKARADLEAAQGLDRLKSDFVNSVSHELRTPLTSIMGYAEFLEDGIGGQLSDEQLAFVRQIEQSSTRLERLVDDLLDFARMEAGTFRLNMAREDLSAKIQEVAASLKPQIEAAGLTLRLALGEEVPCLEMDSQRIAQVLINLLNNAIKFTPVGGLIAVRLRREDGMVRCEVSDSGEGIAPEEQAKLFQRFSQLSTGARRGGTGLGLSISKALVEAHGGRIGLESAPGRGSTFWFTLPLSLRPAVAK
ncbi:MAG TPA: HAMP domain-containing sensor histidine kinase [Pantanalinema sp.]